MNSEQYFSPREIFFHIELQFAVNLVKNLPHHSVADIM